MFSKGDFISSRHFGIMSIIQEYITFLSTCNTINLLMLILARIKCKFSLRFLYKLCEETHTGISSCALKMNLVIKQILKVTKIFVD